MAGKVTLSHRAAAIANADFSRLKTPGQRLRHAYDWVEDGNRQVSSVVAGEKLLEDLA